MWAAADATDANLGPYQNFNVYMAIFFILIVFITGFFILNVFVAVFVDSYKSTVSTQTKVRVFWRAVSTVCCVHMYIYIYVRTCTFMCCTCSRSSPSKL